MAVLSLTFVLSFLFTRSGSEDFSPRLLDRFLCPRVTSLLLQFTLGLAPVHVTLYTSGRCPPPP